MVKTIHPFIAGLILHNHAETALPFAIDMYSCKYETLQKFVETVHKYWKIKKKQYNY